MKKFLSLLLALAMIFTLAACGNKETNEKDDKDKDESETVKYLLTEAEIDGEKLSKEDMEDEFGDDSYIEICDDGTAVMQLDGDKMDMVYEDDEIWAEDDEDTVYDIQIKKSTVIITMDIDDRENVLTFEKESDEEETEPEETEEEKTEPETTEPETTEPEVTEPEVTEPENTNMPTYGSNDGVTYESAYADLRFTLPQGWTYATDEEIAELMGIGAEFLDMEEEYQQIISGLTVVYDMMATAPNNSNIIVMFENLAINGASGMTEQEYIDVVAPQLEANSMGYQVDDEITTVQICGNPYYRMSAAVSYNGVNMTQSYYLRSMGDYMICICITCTEQTTDADILANFN